MNQDSRRRLLSFVLLITRKRRRFLDRKKDRSFPSTATATPTRKIIKARHRSWVRKVPSRFWLRDRNKNYSKALFAAFGLSSRTADGKILLPFANLLKFELGNGEVIDEIEHALSWLVSASLNPISTLQICSIMEKFAIFRKNFYRLTKK